MLRPPTRFATARRRARGFTLTELMIVVVIVGVLGAIAYPLFVESMRKSRRAEAFTALAAAQQAQERWRGSHAAYADTLGAGDADDPGLGLSDQTPTGYYTVAVASADATSYVLTAVGNDGTSQAGDATCRKLAVRMLNGSLQYAGCGSCESYTFTATNACWAR